MESSKSEGKQPMETLWFCLVAIMIAMYVVFDGFDLGVGILHLYVAKTDSERVRVLRSIGPVWDGNEVWLLAAGGTLYFAFPLLYASSFSGFYLPLMMVLWLLMLRGIAIEFRSHVESAIWKPFWGRDLLRRERFAGPVLWSGPRQRHPRGTTGRFGLFLRTAVDRLPVGKGNGHPRLVHSAGGTDFRSDPDGTRRALDRFEDGRRSEAALQPRRCEGVVWLSRHDTDRDGGYFSRSAQCRGAFEISALGLCLSVAGSRGSFRHALVRQKQDEVKAFLSSCAYIVGMLTSAVFGVYPYVLPSNSDPNLGITLYKAAAPLYGLTVGLAWWIPGMLLVTAYFVFTYRHFAGKVRLEEEGSPSLR
jgi:cytochrome d ubiquinol oxidase subunit II